MTVPKISIIVPVFNVEQYLPRCIDSILNQSFRNFELLLIDDGSSDNSGNICDRYAKNDFRIKVFHKKNGGVSSARNVGIDNAIGDWIFFSDADDELFPNGLSILYASIGHNVDLVMAGYERYSNDGKLAYSMPIRSHRILNRKEGVRNMFRPLYYEYQGYLWTKLFKREIIQLGVRFDERIYFNEDRLFCVNYLCLQKGNVFYTTTPVYKYYERSSSAISTLKKEFNYKFLTDFDSYIQIMHLVSIYGLLQDAKIIKFSFISSYMRIQNMMKYNGIQDLKLKSSMKNVLYQYVSSIDLLWYYLVMYGKRLAKKLGMNKKSIVRKFFRKYWFNE